MTNQNRNVLITGGTGILGSAVTKAYLAQGDDVAVTYHLYASKRLTLNSAKTLPSFLQTLPRKPKSRKPFRNSYPNSGD